MTRKTVACMAAATMLISGAALGAPPGPQFALRNAKDAPTPSLKADPDRGLDTVSSGMCLDTTREMVAFLRKARHMSPVVVGDLGDGAIAIVAYDDAMEWALVVADKAGDDGACVLFVGKDLRPWPRDDATGGDDQPDSGN